MDIIMAISCTGTFMTRKGFIRLSNPSVRLLGVVVSVITEEPMIRKTSLTAIMDASAIPSFVICSFQIETTASPGVRNKLNTTAMIRRNTMDFIPRTINFTGTFESFMISTRNSPAITYPTALSTIKREMI